MLKDCLEVFKRQMQQVKEKGRAEDALILDSYIPADGCYISVNSDGIIACQMDLKFNKKAKQMEGISQRYYGKMCFFDYHSRLVSMDKPVDPKKVIHSNNYLSFWVKQESLGNGKLNQEAIDRYFDVLKNPEKKYAKSKKLVTKSKLAGAKVDSHMMPEEITSKLITDDEAKARRITDDYEKARYSNGEVSEEDISFLKNFK